MYALCVFFAAMVLNARADSGNCTVSWCCRSKVTDCHVRNATWSETSNCTCECEPGYFSVKDNNQCSFCGGHGISWNDTTLKCECENKWTDEYYCNICPTPYGGVDCDRCEDGVDNDSFPACNKCIDGYFKDPSLSNGSICLPSAMCNAEYCAGNKYLGGHVINASVLNNTCICNCEEGWYGEFNNEVDESWWGACYFCSGHGTGYDGNCSCSDKYLWNINPKTSCQTCGYQYNSSTCNKCASPKTSNMYFTKYPECRIYFKSPFSWSLFWKIVLPIGGIFVAGGIMFLFMLYYIRRKRRIQGTIHADNNIEIGNTEKKALKEVPYAAC